MAANIENFTGSAHPQIAHSSAFVTKGMYVFLVFASFHVIRIIFIVTNSIQWRIQDFPEEGALTPKGGAPTYYLANFS